MKVAVIGAGVVGASIAWRLCAQGAKVLLIDSAQPGEATSNASFAWVNASSAEDSAYFALREHGVREIAAMVDELGSSWLLATGHLRWDAAGAASAKLSDRVHALAASSYPAELMTAHEVNSTLERQVRFPHPDHPVAYYPTELAIDGRRLARQLTALCATHGVSVLLGRPVEAIGVSKSGVRSITVGSAAHVIDAVVNAAGPLGGRVARMVGRELRMIEEPGLVARVHCTNVPLSHAMHAPSVEIRPDGPQQVLIHSRVIDSKLDPTGYGHPGHVDELISLAVDVLPELQSSRTVDVRVGWRPIPWDGFPSVGPVRAVPGYYEAVTHSGVTLCGIIGRLLSMEIVGGESPHLLAPFRPDRDTRSADV
ncbi:MAG: FAD-binding oxidoreductase [Actinomycetota bacterium]|nr:FAD-binding oxidoreductase [Actinomycetota bacterium]